MVIMSESELAEGAAHAAEALNLDLTDPSCFAQADAALRAAESGALEPHYDARVVRRWMVALATAAQERGVAPAQLWNALDALERC